jgi:hypothetical protein
MHQTKSIKTSSNVGKHWPTSEKVKQTKQTKTFRFNKVKIKKKTMWSSSMSFFAFYSS